MIRVAHYVPWQWLQFACLPTLTLHAAWQPHLLTTAHWAVMREIEGDTEAASHWHYTCSKQVLQQQALAELEAKGEAIVGSHWALASTAELTRLVHYLGAAMCATDLSRIIAGSMLRDLAARLTPELIVWARRPRAVALPGPEPLTAPNATLDQLIARIERYGQAALDRVWENLPPGWAGRARLKCPPQSPALPAWSPSATAHWVHQLNLSETVKQPGLTDTVKSSGAPR